MKSKIIDFFYNTIKKQALFSIFG